MKFAFLSMVPSHTDCDRAKIHNGDMQILGVQGLDEAVSAAKMLQDEGVDCIELCGAFGEAGAKAIIEATGGKLPIGYVTHLPEQDDVYAAAFGK